MANFLSNFRHPKGLAGGLVVRMMNLGHAPLTRSVINELGIAPDEVVLDIGCGGGAAVALMARQAARVYGVDQSEVSVKATKRKNASAIRDGKVKVELAGVDALPFPENSFDLITAFETIYFWQNVPENFRQIYRLLRPGGRFAIALEAYMKDGAKINCPSILDSLQAKLYSFEDLQNMSAAAGFPEIRRLGKEKGPLCVCAYKGA